MAGKHDKVADKDRFSILVPDITRCFICGTGNGVALHEVFYGTANRSKSKEDGMCCPLCRECHQGTYGVHNNKEFDLKLKKQAEKIWIMHYANASSKTDGINKFIKRYGKNYLDNEDL